MSETFVKHDLHGATDLLGEAAALSWLAEAQAEGGLHAVRVFSASNTRLVEERVDEVRPTPAAARAAGRALAHTHAAGAPSWGCAPPGWDGPGYRVRGVLTPVVPGGSHVPSGWGAFYSEWRILYFVRQLFDQGFFTAEECALLERVASRVADGVFDAEQPLLVRRRVEAGECACARLHGDLWAGNLLWEREPRGPVAAGGAGDGAAWTGAALIDPMAHGGHAECDLAMLQLFGCAHLDELLGAYNEASPLADGWRERVGLHQLAPLLLHCLLYGYSYKRQTLVAAHRYA